MARPRKPTALLELTGAFKKDPQRRRNPEPQPAGPLGEAPGWLTEAEAEVWAEIATLAPPNVLKNSDRLAVELACQLMASARRREIETGELAQLTKLLSALGMTPADRSRISVEPTKKKNSFTDLAAETRHFASKPN